MTTRRSIQQACCKALQVYVQAEFNKLYDPNVSSEKVQVLDAWPEAGVELPEHGAVSIIMAGERRDTHLTEEVVRSTDKPNNQAEYEWTVKAITQPIQLDIWAKYNAKVDLLQDDLDTILHRGPAYTLGIGRQQVRDGVLLALDPATGHQGKVDLDLLGGPRKVVDDHAVKTNEFRALIRAELDAILTIKATTAKLARVKIQGLLDADSYQITLTKVGNALEFNAAQSQM